MQQRSKHVSHYIPGGQIVKLPFRELKKEQKYQMQYFKNGKIPSEHVVDYLI